MRNPTTLVDTRTMSRTVTPSSAFCLSSSPSVGYGVWLLGSVGSRTSLISVYTLQPAQFHNRILMQIFVLF